MLVDVKMDEYAISSKLYLEKFRSASDDITKVKSQLESIRATMEKHILDCKISRGVGTGASTVGFIMALFTPICPPVGIAGIGLTLAGGTTNLGTAIGDAVVTSSKVQEISSTVERFKAHFSDVLILCEKFAQTIFYNQKVLKGNFELMKDLMTNKNNQMQSKMINLKELSPSQWVDALKIGGKSTPHIMVFTCASYACPEVFNAVIATLKLAENLPIIGNVLTGTNCLISALTKAIGAGCAAGSNVSAATAEAASAAATVAKTGVTRAISPALGILGGVFVVADITLTIIQNHCQKHVTIKQIDSVLPFIDAINGEMNKILHELEDFLAPGA